MKLLRATFIFLVVHFLTVQVVVAATMTAVPAEVCDMAMSEVAGDCQNAVEPSLGDCSTATCQNAGPLVSILQMSEQSLGWTLAISWRFDLSNTAATSAYRSVDYPPPRS